MQSSIVDSPQTSFCFIIKNDGFSSKNLLILNKIL